MCFEGEVVGAIEVLIFERGAGLRDIAADLGDGVLLIRAQRARDASQRLFRGVEQFRRVLLSLGQSSSRHIG